MTIAAVSLDEEGFVKLILEFMDSRKLHKAMRSLEKDSGVVNCPYSDDVLFLRELVLDGEWEAILVFAQPFEGIEAFDRRLFRYYVLKQKFMEVLYFKSGIGGGSTGYSIEDLIKCLNQLERDCQDKNEYSKLCWLLTVNNLSEQPEYRDWNPESTRIKCFEDILELLKKVLPVSKSKKGLPEITKSCATPVKERLVNLIVKGLCFENCVAYCQHRAINGDIREDSLFPWRDNLLIGPSHQESGNFLSWLRNLDQYAFTTAFEPMALNIELKSMTKPSGDAVAKKTLRRDDAEILSRSLSLTGRPATADLITQSVSHQNRRNEAIFNRPHSATGKLSHFEFQDHISTPLDTASPTSRNENHCGDVIQTEIVVQVNAQQRNSVNAPIQEQRVNHSLELNDSSIYQLKQEQQQNLLRKLKEHEKSKAELQRQLMECSPVENAGLSDARASLTTQERSDPDHVKEGQRTENTNSQAACRGTGRDELLSQQRSDMTNYSNHYQPSPNVQPNQQTNQHPNQQLNQHPDQQQNQLPNQLPNQHPNQHPNQQLNQQPNQQPHQQPHQQQPPPTTSTPLPKENYKVPKLDCSKQNTNTDARAVHESPRSSGLWIALDDDSVVMNTSTPKPVRQRKSISTPCLLASPIQSVDRTLAQTPVSTSEVVPDQESHNQLKAVNNGHYNENKENSDQDIENMPQKRGPKVNGVRRALVQQATTTTKTLASEDKHKAKTPHQTGQTHFQAFTTSAGQAGSPQVDISKSDQDGVNPTTGNALHGRPVGSSPSGDPTGPYAGEGDLVEKQSELVHSSTEPRFYVVATLEDPQAIRAVSFHPGGEFFAVGSNSKSLRVCSSASLTDQRKIRSSDNDVPQPTILFKRNRHHRGSIYCVAWNNTGDLIATGSNDKSIKILRFDATNYTQAGPEIEMNIHSGTVRDVTFVTRASGSPVLVSGGAGDGNIVISDCLSGQTVGQLKGHTGHVMSLYGAGDGIIASGSADNMVRLWDLRSQRCIDVMATGDSCVASVCINTPGNLLASGHEDGACMIYDITAGRTLQFFKPHTMDCRSVRFSADSHFLLSGSYDASITLMDMHQNLESTIPPHFVVGEHRDKVIQCRWHPHSVAFVSSSADRTVNLWALEE